MSILVVWTEKCNAKINIAIKLGSIIEINYSYGHPFFLSKTIVFCNNFLRYFATIISKDERYKIFYILHRCSLDFYVKYFYINKS